MNVWHLVYRIDSLTYTVAKALSEGGHHVFVWVVEPKQEYGLSEGIYTALRDTPRVTIGGRDESKLPDRIERLIVQVFPRPLDSLRGVRAVAARSERITLITSGDRSRSLRNAIKMQWLEGCSLGRYAFKVDRVVYKDGFFPRDLFGLFKPRHALGFDAHSQFLHDEELRSAMHAADWDAEAHRPIRVNFMGCQDPDVRKQVLDTLRPLFHPNDVRTTAATGDKAMFWHEYTNAAPVGLDPREFVRILTESDFTLCPRGYSLVTHRPIEALLRGSVPVLAASELDLYGVVLVDGENCIAVHDAEWSQSIERVTRTDESVLVRMRANIRAMIEKHLRYDILARKMRRRLGVGA
jgi:hypothetical protein